MKKKILTLLALLMTAVTGAWAQEQSETIATTAKIVQGTHFTISNNNAYADTDGMSASAGITVTAKNGETITKVVIPCTYHAYEVEDGNTSVSSGTKEITNGGGTITVTGVNASTFTFTCSNAGPQFSQFVVYYTEAPAAPTGYTVSMKKSTEDATSWQGKAGEGEYQALPLEGVFAGTAVSVKYNGKKKVKSITATIEAANVPVESITLNKTATEITVGQTETLSVTEVLPANATDPTYTWKSSAESKATVNPETGEVTAVAAGTVTIYAEANDGSGVKGECAVTVKAAVPTLSQVTTSHIGYLVTTDGCLYATLTDVIAAGKTAVAMVAYAGNQSDCTHGLAIALANESNSMSMTAGVTECSNKNTTNPVAGGTWRLPSSKDWQYMCFGCGAEGSYVELNGNESFDCSGLVCLLSAALGNSLSTFSWSSTHKGGEDYFYLQVSGGTLSFFYTNSSETNAIRAVLAF